MKKTFFILLCLFAVVFTVKASDDKPITVKQLPLPAQQFIKAHFAKAKVALAKMDSDLLFDKTYEVLFTNGSKVEFDKNGAWKEVDCREGSVPSAIVPQAITKYVRENYPDQAIKEIEWDKKGYDIKLSNGLKLEFNTDFQLIDLGD